MNAIIANDRARVLEIKPVDEANVGMSSTIRGDDSVGACRSALIP